MNGSTAHSAVDGSEDVDISFSAEMLDYILKQISQ